MIDSLAHGRDCTHELGGVAVYCTRAVVVADAAAAPPSPQRARPRQQGLKPLRTELPLFPQVLACGASQLVEDSGSLLVGRSIDHNLDLKPPAPEQEQTECAISPRFPPQ